MAFDRRRMQFYTPAQLEQIRNPKPVKYSPGTFNMLLAMSIGLSAATMSDIERRKRSRD